MSDNELSVDIQSLTNKYWKLREYSDRQIDFISQKYGLSRLVSKLLNIRNISEQDIPSYINPSLKESLPDPYNLVDMEKSCDRLYKAILANDYDEMEELGIYELVEEDVALCEFVDVSKNEIQKLLRKGLNLLKDS